MTFCDSCRRRNGKYRVEFEGEVFWVCYDCYPHVPKDEEASILEAFGAL